MRFGATEEFAKGYTSLCGNRIFVVAEPNILWSAKYRDSIYGRTNQLPHRLHTPVVTESTRNVLRTGEILAPRGADDGRSGWFRGYTLGSGKRRVPSGDTLAKPGLRIPYPLLFVK